MKKFPVCLFITLNLTMHHELGSLFFFHFSQRDDSIFFSEQTLGQLSHDGFHTRTFFWAGLDRANVYYNKIVSST